MDAQNRWTVGVRTGPKKDTVCIKYCTTENDVFRFASPRGSTINEAVHKAAQLYNIAVLGHSYSCRRTIATTPVSSDGESGPRLDN